MIWKYLKRVIKKIGISKIAYFSIFVLFGYILYFSQPYFITNLFSTNKSESNRLVNLIALIVSLMTIPFIDYFNNTFVQAVRKYSKQELWEVVTNKPFSYFSKHPVGKVQSYIKDVSFACRELEQSSLKIIIQMAVMIVLYTIMIGIENKLLGFLYLVFFSGYLAISVWMAKRNRKNISNSLKSASVVNEYMIDYYRNIETISSSNSEEYESNYMNSILSNEQKSYQHVQSITNQAAIIQQLIIVVLACLIAAVGQHVFGSNKIQSLSVILILLYSILNLSGFGPQYLAIEELLNRIRAGLSELGYGVSSEQKPNMVKFDDQTDEVVIRDIDYSYKSDQAIFHHLNLTFEKNKMNALTGQNGSGKSTLLKILSGFYTPSKGEIIFPFQSAPKIMYIAQDAPLFNRSIYKNICYPNLNASIKTVLNLVKEIGLDTLIQTRDDLNNKTPGDFKNKISGGEVQKILFLRAIITKPDILLLDEFTSSLDEKAIKKVYLMINKYLSNTTIISVIHRADELSYYSNIVKIAPTQ